LEALGRYIAEELPERIICIGDFFDMHSLSSYDRGTKNAEGARYEDDIAKGISDMKTLLSPMMKLRERQANSRKKQYSPDMHFLIGNHEERIKRHVNSNPHLSGKLSYKDFELEDMGWTVHDFLKPVLLDGIEYVHYVQNRNSANPKASSKASLEQTKVSVTQGHRPELDIHTSWSDKDGMLWAITCGSSYLHDEGYKGYQGNKHWRGVVHKKNVKNGDFDPYFIRLSSLIEEYL
jgi:hypothetical protein